MTRGVQQTVVGRVQHRNSRRRIPLPAIKGSPVDALIFLSWSGD